MFLSAGTGEMKKKSLFVKFTVLIIAAALTIVIITNIALILNFNRIRNHTEVLRNFHLTAGLFIEKMPIGDTAAVRAFIDGRGFDVRYIAPEGEWASAEDVPDTAIVRKYSRNRDVFWYRKRLISLFSTDNGIVILQASNPFGQFSVPPDILLTWLILLAGIFGMVHITIRRWLAPVRAMQVGVKKISEGDFSVSLPETTGDELGLLVQSFNRMAQQIRNDIRSRDQLLRDISHELRSPLSRMLLALEFLPEGLSRQTIRNNIITLEKMTGSILEEERLDSPFGKIKREEIELCSLIDEIIAEKKNTSGSIRILSEGSVQLRADRERLRIVFSNIIDNALKYAPSGKELVEVHIRQEKLTVDVHVIDNGIGIPEDELPFVFEPFYRIDKARKHSKGYGLGMSLAKKIIDAHNGKITIKSTPDKGTAVLIRLPVC